MSIRALTAALCCFTAIAISSNAGEIHNRAGSRLTTSGSPSSPVVFAGSALWTGFSDVVRLDDYVLCTAVYGLLIVDIRDTLNPVLVGQLHMPASSPTAVAANDSCVYVVNDYGVTVVDITDPAAPYITSAVTTVGEALGVTLKDTILLVADGAEGIAIYDISDPWQPDFIGSLDTPGRAERITCMDTIALVADGLSGLQFVDVTDPTAPTILATYDPPGAVKGATTNGSMVYVAEDNGGLGVINAANPESPVFLGRIGTIGRARDVKTAGHFAIVAAETAGIRTVDVSNPFDLQLTGQYAISGAAVRITLQGDYCCIAGGSSIVLASVTDPSNIATTAIYGQRNGATDIAWDDNRGFVLNDYGLTVFEMISDSSIGVLGTLKWATAGTALAATSNAVFLIRPGRCSVIDVTDPVNPTFATDVAVSPFIEGVEANGGFGYIADFETGLIIVDARDVSQVAVIDTFDTPGYVVDVDIAGQYAYVADYHTSFHIIDVSVPAIPVYRGSYVTGGQALAIESDGEYAYVADGDSLWIVDVRVPSNPQLISSLPYGANSRNMDLWGDYLLVARGAGLGVVDVSDPFAPELLGEYNTLGNARQALGNDNGVLVADMSALLMLQLTPAVGIAEDAVQASEADSEIGNAPNPFNSGTIITFALTRSTRATLTVSNVLGQHIATLIDRWLPVGNHRAQWDGRLMNGTPAPTGVYFYSLTTNNGRITDKMLLMR